MVSSEDAAARIEKLQVRDVMIPLADYPKVSFNCSLRNAIAVLEGAELEVHGRRSLPRVLLVLDHKDRLVGIVRRRDILRGLEPNFLSGLPLQHRRELFSVEADPHLSALTVGRVVRSLRDRAHCPVGDVMRRLDVAIRCEEPVMVAVCEMVSKDLALLPVFCGTGERVVGVIRSVDVLRELAPILI
jgi:predicted transcriptional regulator